MWFTLKYFKMAAKAAISGMRNTFTNKWANTCLYLPGKIHQPKDVLISFLRFLRPLVSLVKHHL